jgi:hypothetical protein
MAKKSYQDISLKITFRFASAELKATAERRAKEEGRTTTSYLNALVKADAEKAKA